MLLLFFICFLASYSSMVLTSRRRSKGSFPGGNLLAASTAAALRTPKPGKSFALDRDTGIPTNQRYWDPHESEILGSPRISRAFVWPPQFGPYMAAVANGVRSQIRPRRANQGTTKLWNDNSTLRYLGRWAHSFGNLGGVHENFWFANSKP